MRRMLLEGNQVTTTEILLAFVGIAIGAPIGTWLGILLVDVITSAWDRIDDLVYDIRRKIRNRRK